MNGQHQSIRLREAGYELALSDNWQKVKVSGSSKLSAPLRAQLKADREDILCWLKAEVLADVLNGRILHQGDVDIPPDYWWFYSDSRTQSKIFTANIPSSLKTKQTKKERYYEL